MKGIILAAGKGTRMLPLTERRPKPLVPVLDRPMLEHIITGARDAGVDEFGLIIGHLGDMIQAEFGDGSKLGVKIEYIWQEEAKGTGHAALLAEDFVAGETFFMSWGDIIVPPRNYKKVIGAYDEGQTDAVLSLNWVEDPYQGAAVYVEDGFIAKILEKPPKGTSTTNYNNAGLFVFQAELFDRLKSLKPSPRGEIEVPDAVQQMIGEGKRIRGVPLEGYWSDVARPATVITLNDLVMQDVYPEDHGIYIDTEADVDDACIIKPPIFIGPGCKVTGAQIGPNVVLARDCKVGPGAKLWFSAVFAGATIGDGVQMRDAVVEEGAEVPAGTKVMGDGERPMVVRPDGGIEQAPVN